MISRDLDNTETLTDITETTTVTKTTTRCRGRSCRTRTCFGLPWVFDVRILIVIVVFVIFVVWLLSRLSVIFVVFVILGWCYLVLCYHRSMLSRLMLSCWFCDIRRCS